MATAISSQVLSGSRSFVSLPEPTRECCSYVLRPVMFCGAASGSVFSLLSATSLVELQHIIGTG
jgi:hypothetical protein